MDTAGAICWSPATGDLQGGGRPGHQGRLICGQMQTGPCRCTRAATCSSKGVRQSGTDTLERWAGTLPVGGFFKSAPQKEPHRLYCRKLQNNRSRCPPAGPCQQLLMASRQQVPPITVPTSGKMERSQKVDDPPAGLSSSSALYKEADPMLPALLRASKKSASDRASPCSSAHGVGQCKARSRCKESYSPAAASSQMYWSKNDPAAEQQSSGILLRMKWCRAAQQQIPLTQQASAAAMALELSSCHQTQLIVCGAQQGRGSQTACALVACSCRP